MVGMELEKGAYGVHLEVCLKLRGVKRKELDDVDLLMGLRGNTLVARKADWCYWRCGEVAGPVRLALGLVRWIVDMYDAVNAALHIVAVAVELLDEPVVVAAAAVLMSHNLAAQTHCLAALGSLVGDEGM